ncbi:hypothetical protein LTR36_003707 [Oleoguttula mirabilis]|uniref:Frequency clock protein n=1 Tax=Oleoguttula mirabilis TaxID=1507867 RepID=A0AAV9JIZ0_9PEZI|nr:hypothetical protein LTR36_003707 [Oleoguttula mirabilis]
MVSPSPQGGSKSRPHHLGRTSSGESSNVEYWFANNNNDVQPVHSAPYVDNEPPFFMHNSASSETPPGSSSNSLSVTAELRRLGADGDSTEDFRGIIDDLTVENKRLKRRLRKYERPHDARLKDDELFEVRIHGLPAEKKRELEETLRKFAISLGDLGAAQYAVNGYEGLPVMLGRQHTARTADSAYASMSTSGQGGSIAQSGRESRHKGARPSVTSRRHNVHSFLHHIPQGLLPQPSPASMSELAKQKFVVKRLEQIFAGKGAGAAGLQHSQQQQEVSQTAARADRSATEAGGGKARHEGLREAHIMRQEVDDAKQGSPRDESSTFQPRAETGKRDHTDCSPDQSGDEQRPTRPLDLDPDRAQVPMDNINYMRHLGFSPCDPRSSCSSEDGNGWIYVNLLINMAQLHTVINVTTNFVCQAISAISDKFEISQDGRKVRWKDGRRLSCTNSSGKASVDHADEHVDDTQRLRKRSKHSHIVSGGATQRPQAETNKYAYAPMFSQRDSPGEADQSTAEEDSFSTSSPLAVAGADGCDISGISRPGVQTIGTKPRQKDDGPIIFYSNNAKFCTDLSGERKPQGNADAPPYTKVSAQPIGKPQRAMQRAYERRGPLAGALGLSEPVDIGFNPFPDSMELAFPVSAEWKTSERAKTPVSFEVTGLGGVWPADNFAIDIETRYARVHEHVVRQTPSVPVSASLPPRFAPILKSRPRSGLHICEQIIASRRTILPPSELPPALSFMDMDGDSSSEGYHSDDDATTSTLSASHGAFPPATAPQPLHVSFMDSDEDGEEEGETLGDNSDGASDASLDLLAAAREIDPDAIRAREIEYDAEMAERLAEEIPVGSSAATAGGWSGFASPASGLGRTEYQRAVNVARAAHVPGVERASMGVSLQVQGLDGLSNSGDES